MEPQPVFPTGSDTDDRLNGSPLLARRDHHAASVFRPESLLREARRQLGRPPGHIPPVCILDPDGDIVRLVRTRRQATPSRHWACYHTSMWEWNEDDTAFGIIGSAVGGSFAVLVAEQLFASGCELLISIASAGQIAPDIPPPGYVLIDRALRDEGTSHHYLPEAAFVDAEPQLVAEAETALHSRGHRLARGATWTTDAPFRETADIIATRRRQGILTVEMEAASLLAFGRACGRAVVCLAHVTNQLGCIEGDFEKGEHNGAAQALVLAKAIADGCLGTGERSRSAL